MKEFLVKFECEYDIGGDFDSGRGDLLWVEANSYAEATHKVLDHLRQDFGDIDEELVWFKAKPYVIKNL